MTTNHPANGPVSLDRLHQISEILSKASAQSDGGNLGYAMADAVKVIDGAIAAFGAEPVGYFYAEKPGDWYQISDGDRVPSHRRIPLYSRPQSSPVVKLPNEFISSEGIVVQIEKLMAVLAVHGIQHERRGNSCRAAMLQAEPVSNSDELPLDYLQGHKDGLEWAAQLAEANHPQTGDWLYDDPIELAMAIRKGPDMPTVQDGNSTSKCSLRDGIEAIRNSGVPVDVDKIQSECVARNHTEQHLDMVDNSGDANGRDGALTNEGTKQAGNSPVIPEGSFSGLVNSARALLDVLYEFGADEVAISEYVTNLEDALRVAAAPKQ